MSFGGSGGSSSSIAGSSDVLLSSPVDTQTLAYDSVAAKWKNANSVGGASPTYANLPAGTPIYVDYDFVNSVYPTRPTSRTDIPVVWRGPTAPPTSGGFALPNDEWRVKTS